MTHVWEKSFPSGVHWDCPLPPAAPLESLLETAATTWPEHITVDFYDRTFTYRELHDLATRAARGLQTLGVAPGVHVGLHLPNSPHFVICFFAVLMAGRADRQFQSIGGTAGAQISAHRRRDRGHDHARLADALPADRGLEGRREIPDAGGLQHRELPAGPRCPRLRSGGRSSRRRRP